MVLPNFWADFKVIWMISNLLSAKKVLKVIWQNGPKDEHTTFSRQFRRIESFTFSEYLPMHQIERFLSRWKARRVIFHLQVESDLTIKLIGSYARYSYACPLLARRSMAGLKPFTAHVTAHFPGIYTLHGPVKTHVTGLDGMRHGPYQKAELWSK